MILEARSDVASVHHRDARSETGEKERLFQGGVAAAHDGDVLTAKEEAVAGGAR
jgi:hypothetical protein